LIKGHIRVPAAFRDSLGMIQPFKKEWVGIEGD
jgi:hypothetical protein